MADPKEQETQNSAITLTESQESDLTTSDNQESDLF
jgi:hypothetical protein